jgi:hypothetical protein
MGKCDITLPLFVMMAGEGGMNGMNASIYRISLDVHKVGSQEMLSVKRRDTARRILISLTDGGTPYEIAGDCKVRFRAKKADGKIIYNDCRVLKNVIEYVPTSATTDTVGVVECEVTLYGADNRQLTSPRFSLIVDESVVSDEEIEGTNEFTALEKCFEWAGNMDLSVEKVGRAATIRATTKDGVKQSATVYDGKPAYEYAVEKGYTGTEEDFKALMAFVDVDVKNSLSMGRKEGTTIGKNSTAFGKDVSAPGECSHAEGHGIVVYPVAGHSEGSGNLSGSKGFTILGVEGTHDGEGCYTLDSVTGLEINDVYSVSVCYTDGGNSQGENYGKITAINGNVVTVDKLFCPGTFAVKDSYINVIDGVDYDTEQNVFRIIAKPTIGTRILGYAAHTEGRITQALSKGAHAEGQLNISYGSYSHTEGNNNQAGYSSHAEGAENIASGFWSHAEGKGNKSSGHFSHAEGVNTTASNQCAHAEGRDTTASGEISHAEGFRSQATANISHAEGNAAIASGECAHAEGRDTIASGYVSHTEGQGSNASGTAAHAEGYYTKATNSIAHAEGQNTTASGQGSHAEGFETIAASFYQHVQGKYNIQDSENKYAHIVGWGSSDTDRKNIHTLDTDGNGWFSGKLSQEGQPTSNKDLATKKYVDTGLSNKANKSHAEITGSLSMGRKSDTSTSIGVGSTALGSDVTASGTGSHAEGNSTIASGNYSHAEGGYTEATDSAAHAEGYYTEAGKFAHAEGNSTKALADQSHAEGHKSSATGENAHAEGYQTMAKGFSSHAEGSSLRQIGSDIVNGTDSNIKVNWDNSKFALAKGTASHTEGTNCMVLGDRGHAEGNQSLVHTNNGHAEGFYAQAYGHCSHAEGHSTHAGIPSEPNGQTHGFAAHAEGRDTKATGNYSHAQGRTTTASGSGSHAEGNNTIASNSNSHAEGYLSQANGDSSHAEGNCSIANGSWSHAQGFHTKTGASCAHAEGTCTKAMSNYQHVQGKYNQVDSANEYAHIIGNGTSDTARSNAHTLDWQGNAWYQGAVTSNGADYAEFFEWVDGNTDNEDRVGLLVTLDGGKMKVANSGDEILGIISGTAAVLGDNYECAWNGKFLTDDFGRILYDEVEEFVEVPKITFSEALNEETGEVEVSETTEMETQSLGFFKHPRINPDYDAEQAYVNRANRPEWDMVGMLGKLYLRDDGSCEVNKYATVGTDGVATASQEHTNMRVLSRVSENVVRVLLK